MALGLKARCQELVGVDSDAETVQLARRAGIKTQELGPALVRTDVLVLATPVKETLRLLEAFRSADAYEIIIAIMTFVIYYLIVIGVGIVAYSRQDYSSSDSYKAFQKIADEITYLVAILFILLDLISRRFNDQLAIDYVLPLKFFMLLLVKEILWRGSSKK